MKKLSILFTFLLIGLKGFSQTAGPDTTLQSTAIGPGNVFLTQLQGGGFLTGPSPSLGGSEFYQKYYLSKYAELLDIVIDTPAFVEKVFVYYGRRDVGANGYNKSSVYNVYYNEDANYGGNPAVYHPDNAPDYDNPLGTSDSFQMTELDPVGMNVRMHVFTYPNKVPILQDSFFVSCHISTAANDTLAISATNTSLAISTPDVPFPRSSWFSTTIAGFGTFFYSYYYVLSAPTLSRDIDLLIMPRIVHDIHVGVKEAPDRLYVIPFPNPASDEFHVLYDIEKNETVRVTLTDLAGRVVSDMGKQYRTVGAYTETIDVKSLPAGMYIYKVETTHSTKAGKMQVSH